MTLSLNNGFLNDPQVLLFNSLDKLFTEYDNLNKAFMADFIKNVLNDIPMRNLKQIVKSVSSNHNISLSEYPEKGNNLNKLLMHII